MARSLMADKKLCPGCRERNLRVQADYKRFQEVWNKNYPEKTAEILGLTEGSARTKASFLRGQGWKLKKFTGFRYTHEINPKTQRKTPLDLLLEIHRGGGVHD